MNNAAKHREHVGAFQVLLLALSIFVVVALVVESVYQITEQTRELLRTVDTAVCIVFIADFLGRFYKARSKLTFLRWGWVDLVSSIPMFPFLRWGRLVRVVRVLRLLRCFRSAEEVYVATFGNRAKGSLASAVFGCFLLVVFCSVSMLHVENLQGSNIRTPQDALWWSLVTITTVGYGDKYPVSSEGRLIAAVLMTAGVGLFAIFTGFLASWFLEKDGLHPQDNNAIEELKAVRAELASMKSILQEMGTGKNGVH